MAEESAILINAYKASGGSSIPDYIADYKTWGTDSYVYINKDILHAVYEDTELSMNDLKINGEALEYMSSQSKAGAALADVYGIDDASELSGLTTMDSVAASSTAMTAVAASSTAMTAVTASSTAMTAVAASSTAMSAVIANSTALNAVVSSSTAMSAVAASSTAMSAVAASSTAMTALSKSTTALDALYAKKSTLSASQLFTGKAIVLELSSSNSYNYASYGYAVLADGTHPNWSSYLGSTNKYKFFQAYPQYATKIHNDTDSGDYVYYYKISD